MNLLFEIGCEEIPHTEIEILSEQFYRNVSIQLSENSITYQNVKKFSSPRRLAILVEQVTDTVPEKEIIKKGPPILAAVKNNAFTTAARGFITSILKSQKQDFEIQPHHIVELGSVTDLPSGFYKKKIADNFFLVYYSKTKAFATKVILPSILKKILGQFVCTHNMRWGNLDCKFIRPIRWIVALWGDEKNSHVIPVYYADIKSSNITYGHRFLANNHKIILTNPLDYEKTLAKHYVIADSNKRKESIIKQIEKIEKEYQAIAVSKFKIINIVNHLVEYPVLIVGHFKKEILKIPIEILISEMVEHQKYFPLQNVNTGDLLNYFVITANILAKDKVRDGNNKILQARFNDGLFFYQQDTKIGIDSIALAADKVIYHKDLGNYNEKIERLATISKLLNKNCFAIAEKKLNTASKLIKADLFSKMVYEFPQLQGLMGEYYITLAGYENDIAIASKEHYYPKISGGKLPTTKLAICLALADKLDDLLAFFSIGIIPSGSNDPYALRRHTQGLLRILIEKKISLNLKFFIKQIQSFYASFLQNNAIEQELFLKNIFDFVQNRLRTTLKDYGFNGELIKSGMVLQQWNIYLLYCQLLALQSSMSEKYFQEFTHVYRRIINILSKNEGTCLQEEDFDQSLLQDKFEQDLYRFHLKQKNKIFSSIENHDYQKAYRHIACYQKPLSDFFSHVFVEVADLKLKKNRLQLLKKIKNLLISLPIVYQ